MNAIVTNNGIAVRTTNLLNCKFSIWGILASFQRLDEGVLKTYRLFPPEAFSPAQLRENRLKPKSDYYDMEFYDKYNRNSANITLNILKTKYTFDFADFEHVQEGDDVFVKRINYQNPSTFYSCNLYRVLHEEGVIYVKDNDIDVSLLGEPNGVDISQPEHGKKFFDKHKSLIGSLSDEESNKTLAALLVRTAIRINMIVKDVFPLIPDSGDGTNPTSHFGFDMSNDSSQYGYLLINHCAKVIVILVISNFIHVAGTRL
mgnify:CR=1 FL=1